VSTGGNLNIYELEQPVTAQTKPRVSENFWEAMKHLDLDFGQNYPDSSAEARFTLALDLMLQGKHPEASPILDELVNTSGDSIMVFHSAQLLSGIYLQEYKWEELLALDRVLPAGLDELNTINLVKGWATGSKERIHYPDEPQRLMIEKSISGVPMVKVKVNGVEQTFWIDTGAAFTVLSSDIAEKCGVGQIDGAVAQSGTSTDALIELYAGTIKKLEIGELILENHPAYIIPKENLEVKLFKILKLVKVDGILGWNAIQNLKLEIDYLNDSMVLSKPILENHGTRNFHYLTMPFVSVLDTNGVPLPFFLDTGANETTLYPSSYAYFDTSSATLTNTKVGGAGGFQTVTKLTMENQSLVLGGTRIDFEKIDGGSFLGNPDDGFVRFDGMLGSDIAKNGKLILDYQNGWCGLIPTEIRK
jgi:predicted aspartyl protease